MYEKEAKIVVDYSTISESHKELDDSEDVHKAEKRMQKHINDLMNTIQRIQVNHQKSSIVPWRVKYAYHYLPTEIDANTVLTYSFLISFPSPSGSQHESNAKVRLSERKAPGD